MTTKTFRTGAALLPLVCAALAGLAPAAAFAQASPEATVRRSIEGAREAAGAAAPSVPAEMLNLPSGDFEALMARPDDVAVNFSYALEQINAGNLDRAASALERILLIEPNLPYVRMLYATVLYRMGNMAEAEQEFRALSGAQLSPEARAQVDSYLETIAQETKTLKQTASLSVGVTYDDNRNAFPSGGQTMVLGNRVSVAGEENGDIGMNLIGTYGFSYDPGSQDVSELWGNFALLVTEQIEVDRLNVGAGVAELGLTYVAPFAEIRPSIFLEHIVLDGENYLTTPGVQVQISRQFQPGLEGYVQARVGQDYYKNTPADPFNEEKRGLRPQLGVGFNYRPAADLHLAGLYTFTKKMADEDYEAYTGHEVQLAVTKILPREMFLTGRALVGVNDHDDNDPFVSAVTERRDVRTLVGATLGVPFTAFGPMPDEIADLVASFGLEWEQVNSNYPQYDFGTWRARALVTKRWEF